MDREQFVQRFRQAAARAHDFARQFLIEDLPETLRFQVALNSSFDDNPLRPDERVFPDDGSAEKRLATLRCSEHEVIELLWRDGLVPEWVDLTVSRRLRDATLIETRCCGRFTANEALLYHEREGYPPFHVTGPWLPNDYQPDTKFSGFRISKCSTLEELDYVEAHAAKVWSLTLHGPAFDDEALARLPEFRAMELLETKASPLRGPGLATLDRHAKLRVLRLDLGEFDWAAARLARRARALDVLNIQSTHPITLDGKWPRKLTELRLSAPSLRGGPLPARLRSLWLQLPNIEPGLLGTLLGGVRAVQDLDLSSTPVTDTIIESLVGRLDLSSLDVRDTAVTMPCVRRLTERDPGLWISPKPS